MQRFLITIWTLSCWYSALADYSQMSTHMPGFQSFFSFLHHFVLAKLATTSVGVELPGTVILTKLLICLSWFSLRRPCSTDIRWAVERRHTDSALLFHQHHRQHRLLQLPEISGSTAPPSSGSPLPPHAFPITSVLATCKTVVARFQIANYVNQIIWKLSLIPFQSIVENMDFIFLVTVVLNPPPPPPPLPAFPITSVE